MSPDKQSKDEADSKPPAAGGAIIDATAHRRSRVHGAEPSRRKPTRGIDSLKDVSLKINVTLAETTMPVGEVLSLTIDSVVQLDKPSGDPVDICVENQTLGLGEVIVLQEKLRVRVLEIIPPLLSASEGKTPTSEGE